VSFEGFWRQKGGERFMQLLTRELLRMIPPLYSQEQIADPMCRVKFFMPDGAFTWWVIEGGTREKAGCGFGVNCNHRPLTEYDPAKDDVFFFGFVQGLEAELGYFSLSELTAIRGMLRLPVERDRFFTPAKLSEVKAKLAKLSGWSEE
jgi:Protein of unknown function (DUF2958)